MVEISFPVGDVRDAGGLRVDAFLAKRLKGYSRAEIKRLIGLRRVSLLRAREDSPRPAKAAARVALEDTILVRFPKKEDRPSKHESLEILHEDEHVVAVNKPGDMLSHPTDTSLLNAATTVLACQLSGEKLRLAHRLDRETSGVLLFAKDADTARALGDLFTRREVRKEYLAIVRGRAAFRSRAVERPIAPEGGAIKVRQAIRSSGRPACTRLDRLAEGGGISVVRAVPESGRLHQIRVHLAWLGHPVIGDKLYTGDGEHYMKAVRKELTDDDRASLGAPRQMLHARKLRFTHPATGEPVEVRAPLPEDFKACLKGAGWPKTRIGRIDAGS